MARRGWSTANYLDYAAGLLTAAPLTFACWAKTSISAATTQELMGLYNTGGTRSVNSIRLGLASGVVFFSTADGTTLSQAQSSAGPSTNTWFHAAGVTSAANSRAAYLDGANKGTETTSRTPSGINRFSVGVAVASTITIPLAPAGTGDLAEVGVWNIALSDADIAALAAGLCPLLMHPEALVGYWPIIGANSPENNFISNTSVLTVHGTLSASAHPRIILPHRRGVHA